MRAIVFNTFGSPDVLHLEDVPEPDCAADEVLVAVAATTVNPTDLLMRSGAQAALMKGLPPPWIAGMEFSGRILAGKGLARGTPVIGVINPRTAKGGAYAERIAVPAVAVVPVENAVDMTGAATVPMNALTAMLALDLLGLSRGQSLLVTGGAGMLGGYVIALARARGLTVAANVADADAETVTGFGADHILPRDTGRDKALRGLFPEGVDGLIDGALIGNEVAPLVKEGGGAVSLRKSHPITDPRLKVHYVSVTDGMTDNARLAQIGRMISDGTLPPRIAPGGVFGAGQAAEAHRMAERGGFRGRVVLIF